MDLVSKLDFMTLHKIIIFCEAGSLPNVRLALCKDGRKHSLGKAPGKE